MCNYSAPSAIKSDVSGCILKLMGQVIASPSHGPRSLGIMLSPGFAYSKNRTSLFATEYAILTTLSNLSCSCDSTFQLLFDVKSKVDAWFG